MECVYYTNEANELYKYIMQVYPEYCFGDILEIIEYRLTPELKQYISENENENENVKQIKAYIAQHKFEINFEPIYNTYRDLRSTISSCLNQGSRFIIIEVTIHSPWIISFIKTQNGLVPQLKYPKCSHGNIIIVDTERKQIERFEPFGASYSEKTPGIDDELDFFLTKGTKNREAIFPHYKYFGPLSYCPLIGPQENESKSTLHQSRSIVGAFCHWWNIYYLITRINYPKLDRKEIVEIMSSWSPDEAFEEIYNLRKTILKDFAL